MIILVLSLSGLKEILPIVEKSESSFWLSSEVLSENELLSYRSQGYDISVFSHVVGTANPKGLAEDIEMIKLHHPGHAVWTQL